MIKGKKVVILGLVLIAFPFALPPESRLERKTVVIHKGHFGQGTMEVVRGVRILHLHGTPFEMGYQHGAMLRDELESFRKDSFDYLRGFAGREFNLPDWLVRPFLKPALYFWSRMFLPRISRDYRDEMRGLAKGAGMSFDDVLLLNVIWEIGELHACSELALGVPATRRGKLWHGYIYDLIGSDQWFLDSYKAVIFYHPEGRQAFVSVGYMGMVGVYTGMNSSGISLGWDNSRLNDSEETLSELKKARRIPEPFVFSIRRVMEEAENMDRAVSIMSDLRRPLGDIVIIASRDENRAVALETFSALHVVREMEAGAVWSANCFASREMGRFDHGKGKLSEWEAGRIPDDDPELFRKNFSRHVRYAEMIQGNHGRIDLEQIIKILRDPYTANDCLEYQGERTICSNRANFSVIYNLSDSIFWVALGSTPAPLHKWVGIDFFTEQPLTREGWPPVIPEAGYSAARCQESRDGLAPGDEEDSF